MISFFRNLCSVLLPLLIGATIGLAIGLLGVQP